MVNTFMKIILIHVPKAAGNSIKMVYEKDGLIAWSHNLRKSNYTRFPDSRLAKLTNRFYFLFKHFYFTFAVIRNPWDRVFSAYKYLSKGGNCQEDQDDCNKYIVDYKDFKDFVRHGLSNASKTQIHFIPQTFWFCDNNNNVLVNEVIKLDNLEESLAKIMRRFNKNHYKLPVANKSNSLDYRQFYNEETIAIVKGIYKQEIELFNFNFE